MNQQQFNQKWSAFLEEGFYGLAINNPLVIEYLDQVFEGLTKIPGFKYYQIKEKFNYSQFYSNLNEVTSTEIGLMIQRGIQDQLDFLNRVESEIRKRQMQKNASI